MIIFKAKIDDDQDHLKFNQSTPAQQRQRRWCILMKIVEKFSFSSPRITCRDGFSFLFGHFW